MLAENGAPGLGYSNDRLAPILLILTPLHEAILLHGLEDPGQAGQVQAGLPRNHGRLDFTGLFEHPQHAPFLLGHTAVGEHGTDGFHHLFTRAQQGDGQRALGFAETNVCHRTFLIGCWRL